MYLIRKFQIQCKKYNVLNLRNRMRKQSQNNRSALLMAGQNSLSHIQPESKINYNTLNSPSKQEFNMSGKYYPKSNYGNEYLYQSQVRQVYSRKKQQQNRQKERNYLMKNERYYPQYQNVSQFNTNKKQSVLNTLQNTFTKNKQFEINPYQNDNSQRKKIGLQQKYFKQQNENYNKSAKISYPNYYNNNLTSIDNQRIKKIMMRLTFVRLRKMQALVRGFLTRRKVYPKLLKQYLIAKSLLDLVIANVVYRQSSTIIMQTITFPKYQNNSEMTEMYKGRQKMLQDLVYDDIASKVIRNLLKPIIQQSTISRGLLMNRPQITFGFNLRDPLQLILYEKLIKQMNHQLKQVCTQSISQYALDRRQLFIIDEWIQKHKFLQPLYEQIANQLLQQNIGQYIVEDILKKVVKQGAYVIADSVYNSVVNDWYMSVVEQLKVQVKQRLIQQAFGDALCELGYGIQKQKKQNYESIS